RDRALPRRQLPPRSGRRRAEGGRDGHGAAHRRSGGDSPVDGRAHQPAAAVLITARTALGASMSTVEFDPAEIDFFTDETVAADSNPYFAHMLADHPVWRAPKYGVVIVTGYEAALEVYHPPEIYSSINRTAGPVLDLPFELAGDDLTDLLEQN